MKKGLFVIVMVLLNLGGEIFAQDPQFSQYYAAPLYMNPAFAGATGSPRGGINYRSQWPSIEATYITFSSYADYFFSDLSSGVGVLFTRDMIGVSGLNSTSMALQYSYQVKISEYLSFRPGVEASYTLRNVNFNKIIFGDQYDYLGNIGGSSESLGAGDQLNFFDLGLGGLIYSKDFWFGYTNKHTIKPNQSLVGGDEPLQMLHSIHAGYKYHLPVVQSVNVYDVPAERSISPTFQYRKQGKFSQIDLGAYLTWEPIVFGLFYRGWPDLEYNSTAESIIFLVGMSMNKLNIGYSYDYTISGLGIQSGGAHEISLSYQINVPDDGKRYRDKRNIPCPKF